MRPNAPWKEITQIFVDFPDRENGGGFLTDHFPDATKAIWQFEGQNSKLCIVISEGSKLANKHEYEQSLQQLQ